MAVAHLLGRACDPDRHRPAETSPHMRFGHSISPYLGKRGASSPVSAVLGYEPEIDIVEIVLNLHIFDLDDRVQPGASPQADRWKAFGQPGAFMLDLALVAVGEPPYKPPVGWQHRTVDSLQRRVKGGGGTINFLPAL